MGYEGEGQLHIGFRKQQRLGERPEPSQIYMGFPRAPGELSSNGCALVSPGRGKAVL